MATDPTVRRNSGYQQKQLANPGDAPTPAQTQAAKASFPQHANAQSKLDSALYGEDALNPQFIRERFVNLQYDIEDLIKVRDEEVSLT